MDKTFSWNKTAPAEPTTPTGSVPSGQAPVANFSWNKTSQQSETVLPTSTAKGPSQTFSWQKPATKNEVISQAPELTTWQKMNDRFLPPQPKPSTGEATISAPKEEDKLNTLQEFLYNKTLNPQLSKNPLTGFIGGVFDSVAGQIKGTAGALEDFLTKTIPTHYVDGTPIPDTIESKTSTAQKVGSALNLGLNSAMLEISPELGVFKGAEELPVIGGLVKGFNHIIGEGFALPAGAVEAGISLLPISDKSKESIDAIAKPITEALTLLVAHKAGTKVKSKLPEVTAKFNKIKDIITKDIITTYNIPKTISLTPEQIRNYHESGGIKGGELMTPDEIQAFKDIGLEGKDYVTALKNGVKIDIPAEQIVTIIDKPYWSKVKGLFGLESVPSTVSKGIGEAKMAPAGFIEAPTAEQAMRVSADRLANTPAPTRLSLQEVTNNLVDTGYTKADTARIMADLYAQSPDGSFTVQQLEDIKGDYYPQIKNVTTVTKDLQSAGYTEEQVNKIVSDLHLSKPEGDFTNADINIETQKTNGKDLYNIAEEQKAIQDKKDEKQRVKDEKVAERQKALDEKQKVQEARIAEKQKKLDEKVADAKIKIEEKSKKYQVRIKEKQDKMNKTSSEIKNKIKESNSKIDELRAKKNTWKAKADQLSSKINKAKKGVNTDVAKARLVEIQTKIKTIDTVIENKVKAISELQKRLKLFEDALSKSETEIKKILEDNNTEVSKVEDSVRSEREKLVEEIKTIKEDIKKEKEGIKTEIATNQGQSSGGLIEAKKKANDYANKLYEKYGGQFGKMTQTEIVTLNELNDSVDNLVPKKVSTPTLPEKYTGTSEDIITGTEYFHATTPDRLENITKNGLSIGEKARGINGGGKVFVADTLDHALGFMNDLKIEGAIDANTKPVLLRVRDLPHENLTHDIIGRHNSLSSGTAWSYDKSIPPEYLEIKLNGRWEPLLGTTGELKTSKTAERTAQNLVDNGVPVDFKNLAKFETINLKDEFAKAADLINSDVDRAFRIISGEEAVPVDITGEILLEKAREYLIKNPNPELQFKLLNSPILTGISEAAQSMRAAQEINTDSAIGKAMEIKKAREARIGKDEIDRIKKDMKEIIKSSEEMNLTEADLNFERFLDENKC